MFVKTGPQYLFLKKSIVLDVNCVGAEHTRDLDRSLSDHKRDIVRQTFIKITDLTSCRLYFLQTKTMYRS